MNRRQFLGVSATALVCSACTQEYYRGILAELYKQDKLREAESLQKIIDSCVYPETTIVFTDDGEEKIKQLKGIGIVFDKYLITVAHITTAPRQIRELIKIVKEETLLNGERLEEIVKDADKDIAVFKLPKDYKGQRYPFELGDSDKVGYGQEILVIGNPALEGINVREGIVSSKSKNGEFSISPQVTNGDSGSATVDRHTFALLGLNRIIRYNVAYAVGINEFKRYLKW